MIEYLAKKIYWAQAHEGHMWIGIIGFTIFSLALPW